MQRKLCLTILVALLGVMAYLPRGRAQRSPYVPMPVNLPGLLPRFGEGDNNNAPSGGQAASSSSSSGSDFDTPDASEEDLGVRISEVGRVPLRPAPSRGGSTTTLDRCPPQQVPCYDCVVYIARNGQITKYSADQIGRRW